MYHKDKLGDVETVYPDEDMIKVLQQVVKQNKLVLDMNQAIIRSITNPTTFFTEVDSDLK